MLLAIVNGPKSSLLGAEHFSLTYNYHHVITVPVYHVTHIIKDYA